MAKALEIWSPEVIEEVLGADAAGVLPESIRLVDIHLRLPRHHVAMLEHFAERDRTSVSGALARELDGIASAQSATAGSRRLKCGRSRARSHSLHRASGESHPWIGFRRSFIG
ncbi:MAG TPA: hypothetical protein VJ276_16020 [Thermoanaerobaculia bacterium]|nr:hypothetical protein [Thermoanaerobaculia bacterium]